MEDRTTCEADIRIGRVLWYLKQTEADGHDSGLLDGD